MYTQEQLEILNEIYAMKQYYEQLRKDYDDYAEEARYYGRVMSFEEFCECA